MPYDVVRNGRGCDGWAVIQADSGKLVGCHPSKSAAERHRRALYANVADASKTVFDSANRILADVDFWDEYQRQLIATSRPLLEEVFMAGVRTALRLPEVQDAVGDAIPDELKRDKALLPAAVRSALANLVSIGRATVEAMMDQWAAGIAQTTRTEIVDALARAREQSLGSPYVREQIKDLFSPARARRIAVTETTRFFGAGSVAVYRAAELPAWEWQTVEDGLVCTICSDKNGTQFRVASDFAPAHPHCRCFPKPVTELSLKDALAA